MKMVHINECQIANLDFIEGSWKNSHDSAGPRLIRHPISVADNAKSYKNQQLTQEASLHRKCV